MLQTPDFESIKQISPYDVEYWSARDLKPLLGYRQWRRFDDAIQRAMISCEQSGSIVGEHFADVGKVIKAGNGANQDTKDYHLSRFACYLIAQNGDPRKPEIAAAQAYFAVSTRANEINQLREDQEARLEKRLKVSASFKALGKAAKNAGVQSRSFGVFMDAGYLGLYRHTLQELKDRKGIPQKEEYLDRISRKELSAIDFKNELTIGKLEDDHIHDGKVATDAHYFMADIVRDAILKAQQPLPETLPTEPSISKLVKDRRRKNKSLPKAEEEQQEYQQLSLF